MAPIAPFTAEEIYRNLRRGTDPESVHLCDYPSYDEGLRDTELEWKMAAARKAVSMGHALRAQFNVKNRQPLGAAHLVTKDAREKAVLLEMEDVIREELNVKKVVFRDNEEELVEYEAKANFRVLGKELGKDMKEAAELIEKLSSQAIASLLDGSRLEIDVAGKAVELTKDKLDIRRAEKENLHVVNEGTLTVALDTTVSRELLEEGWVRDLVRGIQALRKDTGLSVTDRIHLTVHGSDALKSAFETFKDYVAKETLASRTAIQAIENAAEIEAGDETWQVRIAKA